MRGIVASAPAAFAKYGIATPLAHSTHSVKLTGSKKFIANQSSWPSNGASASVVFDATPTGLG